MDVTLQPKNDEQAAPHYKFYLRSKILYILKTIDSVQPSRVRGEVQDRLRDLTRELRDSRGASFWPLAFAGMCVIFMAALVYFNRPHPKIFCGFDGCSPQVQIRVLRQYNDLDFQLQQVVNGIAQAPEARHFDEKPLFEPGFTLTWLEVNDRGKYWSIKHIDPYFRALRDETGWPILPRNCRNSLEKPVVCDGKPEFD